MRRTKMERIKMVLTKEQKTKIRDIISDRRTYVKIVADLGPSHKNFGFFDKLANVEGDRLPEDKMKDVTDKILSCGRPRETCLIFPVFERVFKDLISEEEVQDALAGEIHNALMA